MPTAQRASLLAVIAALTVWLSGCESLTAGYANNWGGFQARNEMCRSVRAFVRAPLGEDGARRAWFLPFGDYEDGYVAIYAPMASDPQDEYSTAFYSSNVGQLTHYHFMPEFAPIVSSCMNAGHGFTRDRFDTTDDSFRASIRDRRLDRRIEVSATQTTSSFLVTSAEWAGDVDAELNRLRGDPCEEAD